jgi:hypothetical protein
MLSTTGDTSHIIASEVFREVTPNTRNHINELHTFKINDRKVNICLYISFQVKYLKERMHQIINKKK